MSWATMKTARAGRAAPQEILDQVGLPEKAVDVIAWLRRESEAEEVEGQDRVLVLMLQQSPPVV